MSPDPARPPTPDENAAVPSSSPAPLIGATALGRYLDDDFFGAQPTPRRSLPDPQPLLSNLTRCVMEVLAGARELDQLSRWVTDDVYRHLLKRVVLASRARAVKKQQAQRPTISIGSIIVTEPRDGVVEAVVMVHSRSRTRAVAIRLEGLDNRWRASSINVL
ncbi:MULTISPECIES: Rv3235 family protein [unclassified Leifsonia]|uniref:Rv3235 family protein n=1 Tax=unclassified Leifsonia TaxID=2663824 RepID=UPI000AE8ADB7|nr:MULTISPECIES: Rv3235 family protein [unclassified Leifsonia]